MKRILPIMLALFLMLSDTYYAQNYAGIIGRGLLLITYQPLTAKRSVYSNRAVINTCAHNEWGVHIYAKIAYSYNVSSLCMYIYPPPLL